MLHRALTALTAVTVAMAVGPGVALARCPMASEGEADPCIHCRKQSSAERLILGDACCGFQAPAEPQPGEAASRQAVVSKQAATAALAPAPAVFLPVLTSVRLEHPVASPAPPRIQFSRPLLN